MGNVDKRVDIQLSTLWENLAGSLGAAPLIISRPTFQPPLLSVYYIKRVYVGFSILDIS